MRAKSGSAAARHNMFLSAPSWLRKPHPEELALIQETRQTQKRLHVPARPEWTKYACSIFLLLFVCANIVNMFRSPTIGPYSTQGPPHEVVLLSAHMGSKFVGIQQLFASNKQHFATTNNFSMYLVEEALANPIFTGLLPADSAERDNTFRMKIDMILAVFSKFGQQTKWVIWVDGDTWLAARPVNLVSALNLTPGRQEDLIIGTEKRGDNASVELPPCGGINAGVFAIRNSPSAIALLHELLAIPPAEYAIPNAHFDDQCAFQALWKRDANWRKVSSLLGSIDTGRLLQCRSHAKCSRYFPDLCCTAESWSVHWPASDWHDLVERIVEEETGSAVLTHMADSVEVEACDAIERLEGYRSPACSNVLPSL